MAFIDFQTIAYLLGLVALVICAIKLDKWMAEQRRKKKEKEEEEKKKTRGRSGKE